jgi:ribulose 1,5-bisphosphate synthetase/thiazole synthase
MKRPILSCIAATAVLTTFVTFAWAADPVCIVGAGPAGLTVANRLEAKGYETVIFEKQPEVGGNAKLTMMDRTCQIFVKLVKRN